MRIECLARGSANLSTRFSVTPSFFDGLSPTLSIRRLGQLLTLLCSTTNPDPLLFSYLEKCLALGTVSATTFLALLPEHIAATNAEQTHHFLGLLRLSDEWRLLRSLDSRSSNGPTGVLAQNDCRGIIRSLALLCSIVVEGIRNQEESIPEDADKQDDGWPSFDELWVKDLSENMAKRNLAKSNAQQALRVLARWLVNPQIAALLRIAQHEHPGSSYSCSKNDTECLFLHGTELQN
jgi:hypothetical protein